MSATMLDKLLHYIARCLPRRLVMWCYVRVVCHASHVHPTRELPGLLPSECMKAWEVTL